MFFHIIFSSIAFRIGVYKEFISVSTEEVERFKKRRPLYGRAADDHFW